MQPYPPNKGAVAINFKVGDPVKYAINQPQASSYVGVVTEICPGINKVWAEMPVGGNQQFDPADLILVPPEQGLPTVKKDTGYSSYDKEKSHKDFGELGDKSKEDKEDKKVKKLAEDMIAKNMGISVEAYRVRKMAANIAQTHATDVVDKIASDILDCKKKGLTDIQAYQGLYKKFGSRCSDGFIKHAINKIYALEESVTEDKEAIFGLSQREKVVSKLKELVTNAGGIIDEKKTDAYKNPGLAQIFWTKEPNKDQLKRDMEKEFGKYRADFADVSDLDKSVSMWVKELKQ